MRLFRGQNTAIVLLSAFAFLGMTHEGSAPERTTHVTAEQFVRALVGHQPQVVDLFLTQRTGLNARTGQDRPVLVTAIMERNNRVAQLLIDGGACVDLADENGFSPLMAASLNGDIKLVQQLMALATNPAATDRNGRTALHYAIAAGQTGVAEVLFPTAPNLAQHTRDGRTAVSMALEQDNPAIIDLMLEKLPAGEAWTVDGMQILRAAMAAGRKHQVKLLLAKYSQPPVPVGKSVPLLAYEIAAGNIGTCRTLLESGTDPNTILPDKCDADFLALLPPRLRGYIDGDKGVSMLTLASGLGQCDTVRALLAAGADRKQATLRYRMLPLYVAAQTGKWQCAQILLGTGPSPEELRIEISLSSQRAAVIKGGVSIFDTVISTGRSGYDTRTGDYVITDKDRNHRSTIYKVDMPYFMRLSCLDFGMHEGAVPNYPASHGCIRLPGEAAKKLFAEIPIGTLVTVK